MFLSVVARPVVTARSKASWPEIFDVVFGVVNMFSLNKVGGANCPPGLLFAGITGFCSSYSIFTFPSRWAVAHLVRSPR